MLLLAAALAFALALTSCAETFTGPSISLHYVSDPDVRCMLCDGPDVVITTRTNKPTWFECYSSGGWHRWLAPAGEQRTLGQLMNAERFGEPCRPMETK